MTVQATHGDSPLVVRMHSVGVQQAIAGQLEHDALLNFGVQVCSPSRRVFKPPTVHMRSDS